MPTTARVRQSGRGSLHCFFGLIRNQVIQAKTSNLRPSFPQLTTKSEVICYDADKNDGV